MCRVSGQTRDVVILGSTGSIGTQALEIVRANPDRFRVVGLTAGGSNPDLFEQQVAELAPAFSGLGEDASVEAASQQCDVVLNGITGAVGLRPTLAASGGPFRGRTREELADVTPEQAMAHPTWDMGPVITINSATLVNKGLEVIEAHLLFGIPFDRIEVVVHPTSVVHSMVEFTDGSTLAQASPPDMRLPIALGLAWPDRLPDTAPPVDWTSPQTWEFFPLDDEAFPAVRLARDAGERGGTAPAVYNAANEVCVEAFRNGRLAFVDIVDTVGRVLNSHPVRSDPDLTVDDVLTADAWAR